MNKDNVQVRRKTSGERETVLFVWQEVDDRWNEAAVEGDLSSVSVDIAAQRRRQLSVTLMAMKASIAVCSCYCCAIKSAQISRQLICCSCPLITVLAALRFCCQHRAASEVTPRLKEPCCHPVNRSRTAAVLEAGFTTVSYTRSVGAEGEGGFGSSPMVMNSAQLPRKPRE